LVTYTMQYCTAKVHFINTYDTVHGSECQQFCTTIRPSSNSVTLWEKLCVFGGRGGGGGVDRCTRHTVPGTISWSFIPSTWN
jgi:hypothetical protein